MQDSETLISALNILRRVHPKHAKQTLSGLIKLNTSLKDDLLRRSFLEFEIRYDDEANKYFLGCEYNQEEKNYRSPWTNKYLPNQSNSAYFPNEQLKTLENEFNELLELYMKAYYDTGISSAYLWELVTKSGFAGCFCICKEFDLEDGSQKGIWNSMHTVKVLRDSMNVTYKMNSELSIHLETTSEGPHSRISSKLNRFKEVLVDVALIQLEKVDTHIVKISEIIDESETWFRKRIERIFMPKLNAIVIDTEPVFNDRT